MGMSGEDFGKGGSGYENGAEVLCVSDASGVSIWVQDVGTDPLVGEIPQGFPPPGGEADGGHGPKLQHDGTWVYIPIGEVLAMVWL